MKAGGIEGEQKLKHLGRGGVPVEEQEGRTHTGAGVEAALPLIEKIASLIRIGAEGEDGGKARRCGQPRQRDEAKARIKEGRIEAIKGPHWVDQEVRERGTQTMPRQMQAAENRSCRLREWCSGDIGVRIGEPRQRPARDYTGPAERQRG